MYKKFKELLDKTDKTSYQIAKETGISQTAFSNWKSGRSEPSLESLKKLAAYFDKPIEYFLEEYEEDSFWKFTYVMWTVWGWQEEKVTVIDHVKER